MNTINRRGLKAITILHLADLHLVVSEDNPGLKPDNVLVSPPITFQALVDAANRLDVDLVLISGDFFDTYHPSRKLISYAQEQFSRLKPPAIMIPGNHDCLGFTGTYLEPDWEGMDMHPHIITHPEGETLEVPGLPIVIWGKAMVEHSPDFRPLEGIPSRTDGAWHVAMAHGFFHKDGEFSERSSPIHAEEIRSCNWDYIALGHNHLKREISQGNVKAAYCGSPLGLPWRKDPQLLLVTLDGRRSEPVSLRWLPFFTK